MAGEHGTRDDRPGNAEPETTMDPALADAHERVAELEDLRRRALADLDNARKRAARDLDRERERERARVATEWLAVLDNLERALAHAGSDAHAVIDGVRAVRDQAVGLLDRLGYPRRDESGVPFDPSRHAAVGTRAGTGAPPGTVVEVVQPGYGDGERQLRPAMVVVAAEEDG
ncbi:nucleotide exchange factor GrpE [Actinomadura rugatobispora]|uniref:Protein GrpE n=1 Tax=Actinomadura rugatobispora TaxID=1994 RepID=A0ABW0ZPV1_9ACTN|nr:hypothetical protein GCM10010200_002680 [Actinomadura rugatobispora]